MKGMAVWLCAVALLLMGCGLRIGAAQAAGQDEAAKPEFYSTKVLPIFQANCYHCHGGVNHKGGLSLETRPSILRGGHHGAALVPGNPANSLLVQLIRHEGPEDDPMPMPSKQPKLSDADIATIERWVRAGAIMPQNAVKP